MREFGEAGLRAKGRSAGLTFLSARAGWREEGSKGGKQRVSWEY